MHLGLHLSLSVKSYLCLSNIVTEERKLSWSMSIFVCEKLSLSVKHCHRRRKAIFIPNLKERVYQTLLGREKAIFVRSLKK